MIKKTPAFKYSILKANAKINIGLKVLGKRADGYHNIGTIFYPVNLCDIVTIKTTVRKSNHKIEVQMSGSKRNDKNNICFRAIQLFLEEFKIRGYYHINVRIKKNIPIGGGLGGGSSDAAAVLKGLCEIFGITRGGKKLKKIALSLGSDVPFFLVNKPALAKSRGEKIKVIDKFKIKGNILIVNPGIHVSTKWAFDEIDRLREKSKIRGSNLEVRNLQKRIPSVSTKSTENLKFPENDFEQVVFKKYPRIKAIKEKLTEQGASFASMSGSGSSVYGIFGKVPGQMKKFFNDKGYKIFIE